MGFSTERNHLECAIDLSFYSDYENDYFVFNPCGHYFHYSCAATWIERNHGDAGCPICRSEMTIANLTKMHGVDPTPCPSDTMREKRVDMTLKIVLLGSVGTGKTSIHNQFIQGKFIPNQSPTVNLNYGEKIVIIFGKRIRLRLWDTAGQALRSMTSSYLKGAQCVLTVYDVTQPDTLDTVRCWVSYAREYADVDASILMCGNKVDMEDRRQVSEMSGQLMGEELDVPCMEVSAKSGLNIDIIFSELIRIAFQNMERRAGLLAVERQPTDKEFKFILLGDSGTGKTCLLLKYADGVYSESVAATVGIDYRCKVTNIGGTAVRLRVWDTAGQERGRAIARNYARGAQAVIVVYDVADMTSFDNVNMWVKIAREQATNPIILLCATKTDQTGMRAVLTECGKKKAEALGVEFMETSAKNSYNVDMAFRHLATIVLQNLRQAENRLAIRPPSDIVQLGHHRNPVTVKTSKSCC